MKKLGVLFVIIFLVSIIFSVPKVGIFYSQTSEKYYGQSTYKTVLNGLFNALEKFNIEYEIVNSFQPIPEHIEVLVDPSNASLTDDELKIVENFIRRGGKIFAAYESSLRYPDGKLRPNYAYGMYLGIKFSAWKSGGYNYLKLTDTGKDIIKISEYLKMPRGFTFVFETVDATPLAFWTKDTAGTLSNEQYPYALVLGPAGIFCGENIYLHTSVSDEHKLLIINAINHLLSTKGDQFDFSSLERKKLLDSLKELRAKIATLGKEYEEQKALTVKLEERVQNSKSLKELEEIKKEIYIIELQLKNSTSIQTRGIWLDKTAISKIGSPEKLREVIKHLYEMGFNVVFPEVVFRGYTISSKSSYYKQYKDFESWTEDPLDVIIEEAHKYGMEVHAWTWVFAISSGGEPSPVMQEHPNWIEKDKYGNIFKEEHKIAWLSHSNPNAREFLLNGLTEFIKLYDLDGINLDYIRYAGDEMGYDDYTVSQFYSETGIDPYKIEKFSPQEGLWQLWRENLVNTFVKEFYEKAKQIRDDIIISADVYPSINGARTLKKQNWEAWLYGGYIDFIVPMNYRSSLSDLAILLDQQLVYKEMTYIVPGLQMINVSSSQDVVDQILLTNEKFGYGSVIFSLSYIDKTDEQYFSRGIYRNRAVPVHAKLSEIIRNFDSELVATLNKCKEIGLEEASYNEILEKWNQVITEHAGNVVELFDAVTTLFFEISDSDYEPMSTIIILDKLSFFIDILRPRVFKEANAGRYTPNLPADMIIIEQVKPLSKISAPKTEIDIDGQLEDWKDIEFSETFSKYDTGEEASPKTSVKVAYNDDYLYVLFFCEERDMEGVKISSGPRDTRTYLGDSVEVFVLVDEANREYYHYVIGIDGTVYDEKGYDSKWNGDIVAKTVRDKDYWIAEIRINLKEIGITPSQGQVIRANFTRNRWRGDKPQYTAWSVPYGSFHTIERFGYVAFK
ncbi:MAG: family 10 glycosylhydrolase [Fervidobacterium sp.]|uniref:family 10 glycosylhydrolase n=1 Tax=Fervidobacterium sp. TaxID=1871331 RepID=UPI004049DBDE